nr:immunoglobulin heavy chain junction region [Macaca mulatta]MOV89694.1 immunoglobulin heavy chain junction region [Macaca mulatta]
CVRQQAVSAIGDIRGYFDYW